MATRAPAFRIAICCLVLSVSQSSYAQELEGLTVHKTQNHEAKNWALLIGINYTARQDEIRDDPANARALPELKNAANDAMTLADVLTQYYRYDKDHVIVLADQNTADEAKLPTKQNIDRELRRVRKEANEDDTVLFFFAGHGLQFDQTSTGGNNVAMLALDVELQNGEPKGNTFDLPFGLVDELGHIKAKQKLVILDCCYSGEIFNQQRGSISFQPTSDESSRIDLSLHELPTFQAMASCRATQLASDGSDGNSKFTSALLHGLKRIPAQNNKRNVTVHRLLNHTQNYLDESQRPDCRNLVNMAGEFCFQPKEEADFSRFLIQELEEAYLRSMVVSRQGSWWFQEMPWFIPSIRAEMVQVYDENRVVARGNDLADLLDRDSLRRAADSVLERQKDGESTVAKMRRDHARLLFDADDGKKLKEALEEIESDLAPLLPTDDQPPASRSGVTKITAANSSDKTLQAVDVHLLAVVKHALGADDAESVYKKALKMYAQEKKAPQDSGRDGGGEIRDNIVNYSLQILSALCRVDYGELLQGKLKQHKNAADQYQLARQEIDQLEFQGKQQDYVAFFTTFNLCREADAWLGINRWDQANDLLDRAKEVARGGDAKSSPVAGHFLEAHVYRRDAWAKMMQWEIEDAVCSFHKSNSILVHRFHLANGDKPEASTSDEPVPQPTLDAPMCDLELETNHRYFVKSKDYASKVAYLHNLHGIAMGTRFQGDSKAATSAYRKLVAQVESAFTQFRGESADADIERQFIGRSINTQERLGDCNLFGDPAVRDLREAIDDYRRAMMRVHLLPSDSRKRYEATLLYKQALALSLPSSITDHELAKEMCAHADAIYSTEKEGAGGLFDALGTLTTPVVHACQVAAESKSSSQEAQKELRDCILKYRDKVGTTPHRDQLELCLFASKVLLEHSGSRSNYQLLTDADLLLSFCRLALLPYRGAIETPEAVEQASDSVKYLRPYFDTAMTAKMTLGDSYVKELLQIQAEATDGRLNVKSENIQPVLAVYAFADRAYLLVDIPNGVSKCVSLAESYYNVDMVRQACEPGKALPLPDDVKTQLATWISSNSVSDSVPKPECRWIDTVRGFNAEVLPSIAKVDGDGRVRVFKVPTAVTSSFPFELPEVSQSSLNSSP